MADTGEDGEEVYDIGDIRAERRNPLGGGVELLIEWEGYPMHQSKCGLPIHLGTFEPVSNLKDTCSDIIRQWNRRKTQMGEKLFQAFNKENEARYELVRAKFMRTLEEREERSRRLKHRKKLNRRVIEDDDDDDDDDDDVESAQSAGGRKASCKYFIDIRETITLGSLPSPTYIPFDYVGPIRNDDTDSSADNSSEDDSPLAQQRRDAQLQVKQLSSAPTASQELYKDLFVDSQDFNPLGPPAPLAQADDGLFVGPRAVPRAAPFDQSHEGDSVTDDSSKSSDGEPLSRHKAQINTKPKTNGRPSLGKSILSPKSPKSSTTRQQMHPRSENNKAKGPEQDNLPAFSRADTISEKSKNSINSTSMSPSIRRPSDSSLQVSSTTTVKGDSDARQRLTATSNAASSMSSLSKLIPAESSTRPKARRTGPSLKSSSAIRMTNNPEAPKRKQWDTDSHFKTLKSRHKAQIRGLNEGKPDLNALDFVGPAPSNLSKPNSTAPVDNVYGRREVRTRRVQEDSDEERSRHRPAPMADWEANKVPLVCYNWRLSNSCPYPPSRCVFLHRNQDEDGRDLPIGDEHGYVPPKYRKPPVTCLFWLEDPKGCSKPDRECAFAHRNTGYKLLEGIKGDTVPIDPSLPPITERAASNGLSPNQPASISVIRTSNGSRVPTKDLTCYWWLEGRHGCTFSEAQCRFAHVNTGLGLKEGIKGDPVPIDSTLIPASERKISLPIPPPLTSTKEQPNNGYMLRKELTCYYWLEASAGCNSSEADCKFAHKNTGWTLKNGARVEIDPNLLPASDPASERRSSYLPPKLRTPPVTCHWWLDGSAGCNKSDVDCNFAHWNTGWKPREGISGEPIQIDLNLLPASARRTGGVIPEKYREYPLTCHWWLEGPNGCHKSDADCKFAHQNTGWKLKEWPSGERIQIDSTLTPLNTCEVRSPIVPKTNPKEYRDKTCWYWAQGRCLKSDNQCPFKHYLTDVLAGRNIGAPPVPVCLPHLEGRCGSSHKCAKAHVDPALLKSKAQSKTKDNPNLIPIAERDTSRDVQEQSIQHGLGTQRDLSVQHEMTPNMDVPMTASPLVERIPSPPRADGPQEPSISEADAAVPQQSISKDFEPARSRAKSLSLTINDEVEAALKVSFTSLFEWSDDGTERTMLDRRAILLFHPVDHQEELELLTRWLLMHHVEVSNAWFPGAWHYHSEHIITGGSGIVIAHPSFEQLSDLNNFGQMLRRQVRLWSLGMQTNIEHDPAALDCPSNTRWDCIEIFPVGGLIYITEDVFEAMPQLALILIKLFCAKIDRIHQFSGSKSPWQDVEEVNLHWRLCVRPELMEYLFQRCEEQEKALEAGDADVMACAELYTLLSDGKLIEQDPPVRPLESKCDSFPIMSERRVIAEGQPLHYFETLARSREEAITRMVQYYGCVHLDMRRDYRHFYVVHTDPRASCATRWRENNHVLTDVITPEQCISELSKDGLDPESSSIFDFYERYLLGSIREPADDSITKTLTTAQPGERKASSTLSELTSRG